MGELSQLNFFHLPLPPFCFPPVVPGGGFTTVTVAFALAVPFVAVAVTVQLAGAPGAVNRPEVVIEAPVQPLTAQVAWKFAVNCCCESICMVTEEGVTDIASTVIEAVALDPEPSAAVAVAVQRSAADGAVKNPVEVIPPAPVVGQIRE